MLPQAVLLCGASDGGGAATGGIAWGKGEDYLCHCFAGGLRALHTQLGAHILYKRRYIDDHRFTHSELSGINEMSQGADLLLTTENDAVPLFYMRVEVQF
jgi:hypothetical protein